MVPLFQPHCFNEMSNFTFLEMLPGAFSFSFPRSRNRTSTRAGSGFLTKTGTWNNFNIGRGCRKSFKVVPGCVPASIPGFPGIPGHFEKFEAFGGVWSGFTLRSFVVRENVVTWKYFCAVFCTWFSVQWTYLDQQYRKLGWNTPILCSSSVASEGVKWANCIPIPKLLTLDKKV